MRVPAVLRKREATAIFENLDTWPAANGALPLQTSGWIGWRVGKNDPAGKLDTTREAQILNAPASRRGGSSCVTATVSRGILCPAGSAQ